MSAMPRKRQSAPKRRHVVKGPLPDKAPAFASEYGTLDHHGRDIGGYRAFD